MKIRLINICLVNVTFYSQSINQRCFVYLNIIIIQVLKRLVFFSSEYGIIFNELLWYQFYDIYSERVGLAIKNYRIQIFLNLSRYQKHFYMCFGHSAPMQILT